MALKKNIIMKIKIAIVGLLIATVLFVSSRLLVQDKKGLILNLTYQSIEAYHYEHVNFDDELSSKIINKYIESIDYSKRFLLQSDVKKLKKKNHQLTQEIKNAKTNFFEYSYKLIQQRTKEAFNLYKAVIEEPIDINKEEILISDPKKYDFAKNKQDLKERWRKLIKYEVIQSIYTEQKTIEKEIEQGDTTVKEKSLEELKEKAIKDVKRNYDDYFNRLMKLNENDYFSFFMNSLTLSLDPHTEYFAPKQKEDFDIYSSGELIGIGATLSQRYGKIKVVNIVIGGPAWKQGELEEGDVILKVKQENGPPVSIQNMRLDDAVRLIRGKKGTKVTLTVEKTDGTIKDITIVRDKIELEEMFAKTALVIDSTTGHKVAYIKLPGFYINYNERNGGRKCSEDMIKEILKINQESNVDGIIIDLRNNGGGSLSEVIKIAGYFIDRGPIVQVRDRMGRVQVYKDNDKNIYYTGNLLIMTNQFSASASEIFSAAMQDYNRAIIFGTPQTLGKGTVQQVLNFDDLPIYSRFKPLGALKITIQKFYRINGGSTQIKGVKADIPYYSMFSMLDYGEKAMDNALPWDKIKPAKYKKWQLPYYKDSVITASKNRIAKDSSFFYEKEYAEYLKKLNNIDTIPLKYDEFVSFISSREQKRKMFNQHIKVEIPLKIDYLNADKEQMQTDTLLKYKYQDMFKRMKKDYQLQEAFNIVEDMNKYRK